MKMITSTIAIRPGEQALVEELLAEGRADLSLDSSSIGNGSEPNCRTLTRSLASLAEKPPSAAARDLDVAVRDRLVDDRRRDDVAVEDDREVLADVVSGVVGEQVLARRP